jgi:hypothetical protein
MLESNDSKLHVKCVSFCLCLCRCISVAKLSHEQFGRQLSEVFDLSGERGALETQWAALCTVWRCRPGCIIEEQLGLSCEAQFERPRDWISK